MNRNKKLVFVSMYVALAIILDYIKEFIPFLNMPSGGSINISLIPVVLCSFHLGIEDGMLAGFLWWLVSSLFGLNNWFLNVPQYIVDYILPSIVVGTAGLFYKKKNIYEIELGVFVMMIIRTALICISGAIFWVEGMAAGSPQAWLFSFGYNLPYCLATLLMLMFIIPTILKSLNKYML